MDTYVQAVTEEKRKGTIQELLGHKDVATTMIYTHVLNRGGEALGVGGRTLKWASIWVYTDPHKTERRVGQVTIC